MKTLKKSASIILILVIVMTAFSTISASAEAVSFPTVSATSYCEFKATKTIPCYRDKACTIRGTSNPVQTTTAAEIWSGDKCQIISFSSNYIELKYPVSSGVRTAYIKRSDLTWQFLYDRMSSGGGMSLYHAK